MRAIVLSAVMAAAFVIPSAAWAEGCTVEPQSLSLGDYDPFAAAPQDAVTNVSVRCDVATSFVITLGLGNGNYAARRMIGGSQMLLYNLFLDPSHAMVWGDGSNGSSVLNQTSVGGDFPVYARAVAGQSALKPGRYTDIVSVTVTY